MPWKYINLDGFNKLYRVTTLGNVYSVKSKKQLIQRIRNGYKTVYLYNGTTKQSKTIAVSRLVALTFIENPQNKKIVNHKNGDKFDNRIENLEWSTQQENIKHALDTKLCTPSTRKVIKLDLAGNQIQIYDSINDAAKDINKTRHSISRVCTGKNKTAGGYCWKYVVENDNHINEKLVEIDGYDYMVSRSGRVYSNKTKKFLKLMYNSSGYQYVTLCKNKTKHNKYVHQLVATGYIKNPQNKKYVNHVNRKKDDNRVENLEWVTHAENVQHYYSTTSP